MNKFNRSAYLEMYSRVLEIATGTGLIAINIAGFVQSVEATDFSPKMLEAAMKKDIPDNVHFSIEDAAALSFDDQTFDAVIISNALHIMPDPEMVLANIKRVLRPNGILIAPVFSHGHLNNSTWNLNTFILKLIGFETYSKWKPEEYVSFISENEFYIKTWKVLKAGFPLVYLEAKRVD
ncbi:MAG: class I SAM-dependent methyltransferase [Lachnospiraceae bacterium]